MLFSVAYWTGNRKAHHGDKLKNIKGYFIMLPVHWTEGENNLIPYNMRLIANNNILNGDDLQIADVFEKNDENGALL
ncbi:hypothetical protein GNE01_27885 [Klebsiella sp. JL973]|nr:hypothetical protein [Klebsiella sp. JL973]